jgi:hypothetical protein
MEVNMILDSVAANTDTRLRSVHLRYWRPIHSELMTHRVFSRNARSSRAVPVTTLLAEQMFVPQFGLNQRGMQAKDEALPPMLQEKWEREWMELARLTRTYVKIWGEEGMHKQWANRPLEWFGWIDVLVTSTCWENFWALRLDKGAQPELRMLAERMKEVFDASEPQVLQPGEWHLPFVTRDEVNQIIRDKWDDGEENRRCTSSFDWYAKGLALKLSTARCARISYKPFDGNADYEAEIKRYESLVVSRPVHASPAEHQATPDTFDDVMSGWTNAQLHGNFEGWIQHRKTIPNESVPG